MCALSLSQGVIEEASVVSRTDEATLHEVATGGPFAMLQRAHGVRRICNQLKWDAGEELLKFDQL